MALATNNFSNSTQVGQGGYGKVYKGILADGTVVAIKRAEEGSLQGQKEFFTEIELLSRLHHRNLVSLLGYCNEEGEQVHCLMFLYNLSNLVFAVAFFIRFWIPMFSTVVPIIVCRQNFKLATMEKSRCETRPY